MNNKGQSVGFSWIFALIMLFGLGILFIVFNQVLNGNLYPVITEQIAASDINASTQAEIVASIDKYLDFFDSLPFIMFVVIVVYMVIVAIRKEGESRYI